MRTNYVLIDYENVQPTSLSLLNGHPFKVMVFVGANQTKVSLDLAKTLQPMGGNADYVLINGNGRNALDFHITFYLGELSTKDPAGFFHLISKDTGFDPLVAHLKSRGIFAQRSADLREIPILGFIAPKSLEERVKAVIENLANRGSSRPRSVKTLVSTIHALFLKKLTQGEVDQIVSALEKRGAIVVNDGKVSYSLG
jgi:hypothetical protein